MRTVGLFEAKQKLSELVERASEGSRSELHGGKTGCRDCSRAQRNQR